MSTVLQPKRGFVFAGQNGERWWMHRCGWAGLFDAAETPKLTSDDPHAWCPSCLSASEAPTDWSPLFVTQRWAESHGIRDV